MVGARIGVAGVEVVSTGVAKVRNPCISALGWVGWGAECALVAMGGPLVVELDPPAGVLMVVFCSSLEMSFSGRSLGSVEADSLSLPKSRCQAGW